MKTILLILLSFSVYSQPLIVTKTYLEHCGDGVTLKTKVTSPNWFYKKDLISKSKSIHVYKTGIYYCKADNKIDSVKVTYLKSLPVNVISQKGDSLVSSYNPNYQWYLIKDNKKVPACTLSHLSKIKPTQSGWYQVSSMNLCKETFSKPFYYKYYTNIYSDDNIVPVSSNINIISELLKTGWVELNVINSTGNKLFSEKSWCEKGEIVIKHSFDDYQRGYYNISLFINEQKKYYIIKKI